MILISVENGPLIWPTVEENRVIKTKKYVELSTAEKIQVDCDMKATNIILQDLCEIVQLLMQGTSLTKQERECKLYDPNACLNKEMTFLTAVASSRGDEGKVILVLGIRVMLLVLGETMQEDMQGLLNVTTVKVKEIWLGNALTKRPRMQHNPGFLDGQAVSDNPFQIMLLFQTENLILNDSDWMIYSIQKRFLMTIIAYMGLTCPHRLGEFTNNKITILIAISFSDSSIWQENTTGKCSRYSLAAQQDSMIFILIEQMSTND
ncbi:hypothetical protein Tco_0320541 [Tanacetum coccineum]